MDASQRCAECGAAWTNGQTCEDHFHQMLFWEAENPRAGAEVHHLMVLCYHLQHPSLSRSQHRWFDIGRIDDRNNAVDTFNGASQELRQLRQREVPSGDSAWT